MSRSPIDVALVGFGYAGRTFHAPLISACEGLRLTTVVTTQGQALADAWPQARAVSTLDAALADPSIALVVIATPNALHAPQAIQALEAGKAVVVDKPFALTVAEAETVARVAQDRGLLLSVFHNRRWDADFLTLKALIDDGALGGVTRFESHFDRFRPDVRDRWREGDGPGAGIWYDLGPHLIDQALVLFGPPLGITCDLAIQRQNGRATDYAHAVLRYDRLRVVLHMDMMTCASGLRFSVHGECASWIKSGLDVQEEQMKAGVRPGNTGWGADPMPGTLTNPDGTSRLTSGSAGNYSAYYAGIAAALNGQGPNPVPPDQAIAVMCLIEAGIESSERRMEMPVHGSHSD